MHVKIVFQIILITVDNAIVILLADLFFFLFNLECICVFEIWF